MKTSSKFLGPLASALIAVCAACSGGDFTTAPAADSLDPPDSGSGNMDTGTGPDVGSGNDASPPVDSGSPLPDSGSGSVDSGSGGSDSGAGGTDSGGGGVDSGSGGSDAGLDASDAGSDGGVDAGSDSGADAGCSATLCGGSCVDILTDPNNCGACGYKALNGRSCVAGKPYPAWQSISSVSAPPARTRHAAAFLGTTFVVSGGSASEFGVGTTDVGYYNPVTNTWTAGDPLNTARCSHASVASSFRVYAYGGLSDCSSGSNTGPALEAYNASTGHWTSLSPTTPPPLRYNLAIAWIDSTQDMFIYGGSNASYPSLANGAKFHPMTSSWADASCSLAGCDRSGYLGAFVAGGYVKVWGGLGSPGGLEYDVAGGTWSTWTLPAGTPSPMPQRYADEGRRIFYLQSTGACPGTISVLTYDRVTNSWMAADTSTAPTGLVAEAATAWTGSELIAWSGACGSGSPTTVGGRYQPPVAP